MGEKSTLTPEQLEAIFKANRPGSWLVVDVTSDGPRVVGETDARQNAFTFAKMRGGIVLHVPLQKRAA